jgi:hypothetical protein
MTWIPIWISFVADRGMKFANNSSSDDQSPGR